MSLVISKVFTYDTDAGNYIQAVEGPAGDNQALEPAVRQAINNFVVGCKQDGIWPAIKASCILAGARTLSGALQPLAGGTAPTNVGGLFVQADYNRKTGLAGNGSTKYLNSNRALNADPQNSSHLSVYVSAAASGVNIAYCGASGATAFPWAPENSIGIYTGGSPPFLYINNRSGDGTALALNNQQSAVGFIGSSRSTSSAFSARVAGSTQSQATVSSAPTNYSQYIFSRNRNNSPESYANARLAFYSIGESLDLALLDARVTAMINAFGAAIP